MNLSMFACSHKIDEAMKNVGARIQEMVDAENRKTK
jgi:hypothetical protein